MKRLFKKLTKAGKLVIMALAFNYQNVQAQNQDQKIEQLISQMSIEEKVGQMTQIDLNLLAVNGYQNTDGTLDKEKLKKAILEYKVGSVLNPVGRAYSVETWHKIITEIQDLAVKKTPNKIPVIYGIDAVHGTTFTLNSTLFPHNLGLAATRNEELARLGGNITAREVRASGIRWNFSPVLDAGRQPLWSRFAETWGEDTYLTKQMGVATIKGMEADGLKNPTAVASCMKHFIGYSAPRTGKDRTPAHIPDIILREYYLPQFKAAVEAGSSTVMINSGEINGIPTHANEYLLKDVLRKELGFKGLVVTDWEDIIRLHNRHMIASTPKEAVKIAINAGIDMSMVPNDYSFFTYLTELVKEGQVSMATIDASVRRILKLKYDLGLFDNPYPEKSAAKLFNLPEYGAAALQASRESITLLKNENLGTSPVLPLKKNAKILLAGPGADNLPSLHGCWSYTWQGNNSKYYPSTTKTILQAIEEKTGKSNVTFYGSKEYNNEVNFATESIFKNASAFDFIVLCLGEDAYAEQPGAIDDLDLPTNQLKLAKAAINTGKPVILVMTQGRPRVINSIVPGVKGIIQAYWPGTKGADAIADVLFGDYNPDGKLPFSYPAATGDLVLYDHKFTEKIQETAQGFEYNGYKPQWPFGFGLSYTTFEYSPIKVSQKEFTGDETVKISVEVKNTGKMDGKHSIELYSKDLFASVTPDNKRLRKFKKVKIKAGATVTVEFELDKSDLAFVNKNLETVTEPGEFELMIENQKVIISFK
ncbi:MAG: glycoside hydrolase family 3 C-terminal domain-containing protein [Sporocytophaga sp.]|nr:glycoside hydrolase family 3 C-terminal domain-containing protein [Sporocytophaga sp.]